jgi:hypothetical protein
LLDLKTKKLFEFSHHRHLKPISHDLAKLITKILLVEPKMMSSTYIWHTNKSLPIFLAKSVKFALPILKPFLIRKSLRHSYHALGACLSPQSALWSLDIWLGYSSSSKPRVYST